jgi:hypothetical protein
MIVKIPDVNNLPNLSVYEYTDLPAAQGLYFVLDGNKYVYIGKSQNSMKNRWYAHHRLEELLSVETSRIYFLLTDLTTGQLIDLEDKAIQKYKPELNFINKKPLDKTNLERLKFRAKKFRQVIRLQKHQTYLKNREFSSDLIDFNNFFLKSNQEDIDEIQSEFGFTMFQEVED